MIRQSSSSCPSLLVEDIRTVAVSISVSFIINIRAAKVDNNNGNSVGSQNGRKGHSTNKSNDPENVTNKEIETVGATSQKPNTSSPSSPAQSKTCCHHRRGRSRRGLGRGRGRGRGRRRGRRCSRRCCCGCYTVAVDVLSWWE